MPEYIQVFTTCGSPEEARIIAEALVERRQAGCVQIIGPISSTYIWEGEIKIASELLCLAKTERSMYAAVEATIRELHCYDVPEIIAMPIVAGSASYLEWLGSVVTK